MTMYDSLFCRMYNEFGWNEYPRAFGQQLLAWLDRKGLAVRSALDNTGKVILKDHMRHCMVDAVAAGDQEAIDDLCQAIDKFMK